VLAYLVGGSVGCSLREFADRAPPNEFYVRPEVAASPLALFNLEALVLGDDGVYFMLCVFDDFAGLKRWTLSGLAGATGIDCRGMQPEWETIESGPAAAERTVLLLPGGMCSARSYAEVMAEPSLAGHRLVAATLPGHCGTAPPEDFRPERYAQMAAGLARDVGADVVVGFSMGATVAYEMVASGAFAGPLVLLGVSLSSADEPAFFRGIVHLTSVLGTLPVAVLKKGAASMVKKAAV
jgi:pimeloyl-ACP methyl ester carboxylesterase